MIEHESPALEIEGAGPDGSAAVRVVWWRSRESPAGPPAYGVRLDGPFGVVEGAGDDVFDALQDARRRIEPVWRLLIEGSRRASYPSGPQRAHTAGLEVSRWDARERQAVTRGIWEPVPLDETASVAEQQELGTAKLASVRSRRVGDGWVILNPLEHGAFLPRPPRRLRLTGEIAAGLDEGWRLLRAEARRTPVVVAIAPRGTTLGAAVRTVSDRVVRPDLPPVLVVVGGATPAVVRRLIAEAGDA